MKSIIVHLFFLLSLSIPSSMLLAAFPFQRPGIDPDFIIQESLRLFEAKGGQLSKATPKYSKESLVYLEGPVYLIKKQPKNIDDFLSLFFISEPNNPKLKKLVKELISLKNVAILIAPGLTGRGLVAIKHADPILFQDIDSGFNNYSLKDKNVNTLLFIGIEFTDQTLFHEYQHIKEANSGRLAKIVDAEKKLKSKLIEVLGKDFLFQSAVGQWTMNIDMLEFAYEIVTELTAEKARYQGINTLLRTYSSFELFIRSPAFYNGLKKKIDFLSEFIREKRINSVDKKDVFFVNELCSFIKMSIEGSIIEEEVSFLLPCQTTVQD